MDTNSTAYIEVERVTQFGAETMSGEVEVHVSLNESGHGGPKEYIPGRKVAKGGRAVCRERQGSKGRKRFWLRERDRCGLCTNK